MLDDMVIKNDLILSEITKLKPLKEVYIYIKKKDKYLEISNCSRCSNKNIGCIPLNCTHLLCLSCYVKCRYYECSICGFFCL